MIRPRFFWSDLAEERGRPVFQARVMGGGSTVNGMQAQRGFITDYDDWARFGVVGWGGDDVLPYFRKLEADRDFSGPSQDRKRPRLNSSHYCATRMPSSD